MARSRSLTNLLADVRYRADIESLTDRHPDAKVIRLINESWQALRELVSENGHDYYLVEATGSLSASEHGDAGFGRLTLPSSMIRLYGIDIEVDGYLRSLQPITWAERGNYQNGTVRTGVPEAFHVYQIGEESGATVGSAYAAILPVPDAAYTYTLWYLPAWTDRTDVDDEGGAGDVFHGVAGWDDYVIWDCVIKLAARDNDSRNTYQIAVNERAVALERVLKGASRPHRVGPVKRHDARGRRALDRDWQAWRR